LLPVPYLIVEQVTGNDVEAVGVRPDLLPDVWSDVGRDLARLHSSVDPDCWPGQPATSGTATTSNLISTAPADAETLVRQRVDDGWLSALEGQWFADWLVHLDQYVHVPIRTVATHSDVQLSNVLIDPTTHGYRALLDWGCAARRDAVVDFMPMPFAAVPHLLAGHRQVAPLDDDDHAEARILLGRIHTVLAVLPRGAAPKLQWGERPTAWLVDLLRFFQHPANDTWRALSPPTWTPNPVSASRWKFSTR
jgi:aminoglycoside phosphotransferase (APT) family kinase protein